MMARTRSFHLPHSHRSLIEDTKFSYRQIRSSEPKTFFPSRDACKSIPARNSGQPFLWGERILYSAWPANFAGCNFEATIRPENRSPREGYIIIIIKVWLITILKLWRYEENSGWPIIAGPRAKILFKRRSFAICTFSIERRLWVSFTAIFPDTVFFASISTTVFANYELLEKRVKFHL